LHVFVFHGYIADPFWVGSDFDRLSI